MADAQDLGSCVPLDVRVRIPLRALGRVAQWRLSMILDHVMMVGCEKRWLGTSPITALSLSIGFWIRGDGAVKGAGSVASKSSVRYLR